MHFERVFTVMLAAVFLVGAAARSQTAQTDEPTKKLGAFLGKWQTEGTFASGQKATTTLDCRWSPQDSFLICEQLVKMAGSDRRQLTVYSYNSKAGTYSYTTLSDPGAEPTAGTVQIKGNLWTYDSSFQSNGKTTMIRTTNEFTDPKTEVFKVATSDDNGMHWKPVLEGTAHKIAD
ncbi:MAG TPA: hypothetical protein VGJ33_16735 [Candidatus Angelobacter sp.]|jgi:hypothetical protein